MPLYNPPTTLGRWLLPVEVISNADGTKTLSDLIGLEYLKRPLVKRLERLKPSISTNASHPTEGSSCAVPLQRGTRTVR